MTCKNSVLLPKVSVILGGDVTMLDEDPGVEGTNGEEGRYNEMDVALRNLTAHVASSPLMKTRGMVAPATATTTVRRGVKQLRFRIRVRL